MHEHVTLSLTLLHDSNKLISLQSAEFRGLSADRATFARDQTRKSRAHIYPTRQGLATWYMDPIRDPAIRHPGLLFDEAS